MQQFENTARYLKKRRIDKGMTQLEVANKLKIHSQHVSNWERAACSPPISHLQELIEVLELNREILLELMTEDAKVSIRNKIYKQKFKLRACE